ncbi:helix-turn-helix domain-containing protein [Rhizobium leguminosarum]|uniref:helix-turn-helix domain-containing protein n=1 Tax=Rhizobium leguminosarum TaxID=384 RepID=UPI003F9A4FA0
MTVQSFYIPGEKLREEPLHYKDCGLDNIYLKNGFNVENHDGEQYLTVTDIDGLHKAIGMHIVLGRKAPSGQELRFIRNELGMSQSDLARVLDISDQSVARWEKGKCEANGAAVFALRLVYLLSLIPKKEQPLILQDILQRFKKLMEEDETTDEIVLSYSGKQWLNPVLCAA